MVYFLQQAFPVLPKEGLSVYELLIPLLYHLLEGVLLQLDHLETVLLFLHGVRLVLVPLAEFLNIVLGLLLLFLIIVECM